MEYWKRKGFIQEAAKQGDRDLDQIFLPEGGGSEIFNGKGKDLGREERNWVISKSDKDGEARKIVEL